MRCPICEKELEAELSSCPFCGTPLKEVDGEYQKGVFKSENIAPKKYKERAHEKFVENNRTIAGVCSLISLPLMLGALAFMILTFITFNPGTADQYYGTVYTPYSLIFLVPSFILAVVAFFKSKDINFKSVNRLAAAEVIINGIVTLLGFVILILFTSGTLL